jgi:hypothetical protein
MTAERKTTAQTFSASSIDQPMADEIQAMHTHLVTALDYLDTQLDGGFAYRINEFDPNNPRVDLCLGNDYTPCGLMTIRPPLSQEGPHPLISVDCPDASATKALIEKHGGGITQPGLGPVFTNFIYGALTETVKSAAPTHSVLKIVTPRELKAPNLDFFNHGDPKKYPRGPQN